MHREKIRKARKEHECGECSGEIKRGELYWYIEGKCDYDFYIFKMCSGCYIDWKLVEDIYYENRESSLIIYGMIGEAVEEAFDLDFLYKDDSLIRKWRSEEHTSELQSH